MLPRGCGILMPLFSLPGPYGIGDLGPEAEAFAGFLDRADQRYWQVLPLTPTEAVYGNSPYSSNSAFAMDPLFISPRRLIEEDLLDPKDAAGPSTPLQGRVVYDQVRRLKGRMLDKAFRRVGEAALPGYEFFLTAHKAWLEDYALFLVLKKRYEGAPWASWPEALKNRDPQALREAAAAHAGEMARVRFQQYLVFRHWARLKEVCRSRGIALVGDIPIYVNWDSADVWAHRDLFKLDAEGRPLYVAGVPPDYFSATGQRWGNPVYDWDRCRRTGYAWWLARLRHNLNLFDYLRIDHFRGFVDYWEIPAEEETAVHGRWVPGPRDEFFQRVRTLWPQCPIIAEDLGLITPEVTELMRRFDLPGMKVLLFAFGGDYRSNPYLPENVTEDSLIYTGTHDNNTVKGWWRREASAEEKAHLREYLGGDVSLSDLHGRFIEMAMGARSRAAVIPLPDVLGLGEEARINTPGTAQGNWEWRVRPGECTERLADDLARRTRRHGRGRDAAGGSSR